MNILIGADSRVLFPEQSNWLIQYQQMIGNAHNLTLYRAGKEVNIFTIFRLEKNILQVMPWPKDKVELEVSFPGAEILLPEGELKTKVELPRGYTFFGKGSVLVKLFVDGKEYKSVWAKTLIRLYTDMVLASRPILRNELIKEEDLKVERRLVASIPRGVFDDVDEIKGMRAKRKIRKDAVITQSDITLPELFKRGSMVSILLKKGGLAISAKGKAMEKGVKGKVIRVQNINSKKVNLMARMVAI